MNKNESKKAQAQKETEALISKIRYEVVGRGSHKGEIKCMDICI